MSLTRDLDQVLAELRILFAAEYQRGEQDAIARILRAAQGAPAPSNGAGESHSSPSPANRKDRVPAGTAKGLIDRVLRERTSLGATPTEIQAAAETDVEKAISYSGLKFALTNGRDESRYENRGGRWFLKPQNGVPRSEAR